MRTTGIIAIDPGGMTGYALLHGVNLEILEIGEFETFTRLDDLIRENDIVICEQPFLTAATNPVVFEVTGAVKERVHTRGAKLVMQQANNPHFVWRRYEKELKGKKVSASFSQHKKDALAHLIFWWVHKAYWKLDDLLQYVPNK